jgi:RimJ/RimL family protein N-acetyltransferase
MTQSSQPTLETPRLILRPFTESDGPAVERLAGAREVAETTLTIPHPYPPGGAAMWIATHPPAWEVGTTATFAMVDRATNELVGCIGADIRKEDERAEIGYWVGMPFWNRGYCTEAAQAVVNFLFDSLGMNRVQARYLTRNVASGRVMQKIGMRHEGVHRQAVKKWGRFEDIGVYAILAEDRK